MPTTKPTDLPTWTPADADSVKPNLTKLAAGWKVSEKPPAQYLNWWQRLAFLWHQCIDGQFATDGVKRVQTVASLTALGALTGMADGDACYVKGVGIYFYVGADPPNWQTNHAYLVGDRVSNGDSGVYQCVVAGTSAAAGLGPTATPTEPGQANWITDNTAKWQFLFYTSSTSWNTTLCVLDPSQAYFWIDARVVVLNSANGIASLDVNANVPVAQLPTDLGASAVEVAGVDISGLVSVSVIPVDGTTIDGAGAGGKIEVKPGVFAQIDANGLLKSTELVWGKFATGTTPAWVGSNGFSGAPAAGTTDTKAIKLTLANAKADNAYAVIVTDCGSGGSGVPLIYKAHNLTTSTFEVAGYDNTNTQVDLTVDPHNYELSVLVVGD